MDKGDATLARLQEGYEFGWRRPERFFLRHPPGTYELTPPGLAGQGRERGAGDDAGKRLSLGAPRRATRTQ